MSAGTVSPSTTTPSTRSVPMIRSTFTDVRRSTPLLLVQRPEDLAHLGARGAAASGTGSRSSTVTSLPSPRAVAPTSMPIHPDPMMTSRLPPPAAASRARPSRPVGEGCATPGRSAPVQRQRARRRAGGQQDGVVAESRAVGESHLVGGRVELDHPVDVRRSMCCSAYHSRGRRMTASVPSLPAR